MAERSSQPTDGQIQRVFRRDQLLRERGEHPRMRLRTAQFRLGRRYVPLWWLVPALIVVSVAGVVAGKLVYGSAPGQGFIARFPCVPTSPQLTPGYPGWVIWTHVLTFLFLVMIVRSGLQILADHPRLYLNVHSTPDTEWLRFRPSVPRDANWTAKDDAITLTPMVGLPGGRHTIGVARHWHFLFDILFAANGVAFIVIAFATGYWRWLIPTSWSVFPQAVSCTLTYASLHPVPGPNAFFHFNAVQQLTYFVVIYVLGPLAVLTGLAMSPALGNRFKWYDRAFGNRQIARSLHFAIMVTFVAFFVVHMVMISLEPGLAINLNHIVFSSNHDTFDGFAAFAVALAVVVGLSVWATRFSWTHTRVLQSLSNRTVGWAMGLLLDRASPRVVYRRSAISPYFWQNGLVPTDRDWLNLKEAGWHDYRLKVHGLVERPVELSLVDLKELGVKQQITRHDCIQGWSGIAEWGGVPFRRVMELVKPRADARWVIFYSYGEGGEGGQYYDSHSIDDLRHPQSMLAFEMNEQPLPIQHGAPLRLRVENQLGFKQVKWIKEIEFVHHFSERFRGQGGYNEDHEFYGYQASI